MAKNKTPGDDRRAGAVKTRSQVKNPLTGTWTKRDDKSGKFMDQKEGGKPFKGVSKEHSSANSMGVVVADPVVKPREVTSTKIREAIYWISKKS